jgi:hypothetical protein
MQPFSTIIDDEIYEFLESEANLYGGVGRGAFWRYRRYRDGAEVERDEILRSPEYEQLLRERGVDARNDRLHREYEMVPWCAWGILHLQPERAGHRLPFSTGDNDDAVRVVQAALGLTRDQRVPFAPWAQQLGLVRRSVSEALGHA